MAEEKSLTQLILRWQDLQEQGQSLTPEMLCADCPELLSPLKQRLAALAAMEGFLGPDTAPVAGSGNTPQLLPITVDDLSGAGAAPGPGFQTPGYEVLGELGQGGMGVVWKARQVALKRLVALKVILAGSQAKAEQLARFRAEAEAVARLQHPNIVQVYEVGDWQGVPFFSLELCGGGSLANKLRGTPLPAREAAELVETLARAMQAAHEKHILHRDLKPANVLLTDDGVPKISDFGLAKRLDDDSGQTRSGAVLGTPSYMAPEQARGQTREMGRTVDIYALGAILYELLTGRPPFRAATILETLDQVCSRDPVPPLQLQPTVPRDLETLCLKCLHKEPTRRYASALELAGDLRRFLNGEPIKARRAGLAERLVKWARRKPAQAALVAASALLLAVFVFALLREARDYRRKYEQQLQANRDIEEDEQTYLTARELVGDGELGKARDLLGKVLGRLAARPDPRAEELKERARKTLDEVADQIQNRDNRQQAQERERKLWRPHAQALFHWAPLFGARLAESREQARAHAREALALYGLEGEAHQADQLTAVLRRDRPYLSPAEFAWVTEACCNLLLIWADVEAGRSTPANVPPKEASARAERALAVLDRAAVLGQTFGVDTQALHVHKARYLAFSRGEPFDPERMEPAGPRQPTAALDWFLKGLERYEAGRFEEAAEACRQALRFRGDHYWAHYLKGLCDLRAGRWSEGKTHLTFCVDQRADFVWPLIYRGFAASELGARHAQQEALASRSQGPDAEITRQYRHDKETQFASARTDFDTALGQRLDAETRYTALNNRGVLFIRQERWAEASADLRQAVAVRPAAPQAYTNLAQALQGAGRGTEALKAMNQAVERLPEGPGFADLRVEVYGARAKLQLLHKERKSAWEDFERAIAHEPKESKSRRLADNLVESGQLLSREGKHGEALARFDRALRVRPELVLAQRYRAETLLELNRPAEASEALDDYLARTKEPAAKVLQARGHLYAQTGRLPAAIETYSAALRCFDARDIPNIIQTRGYRGWAYLESGAAPLALEDFEECLRREPKNADFLMGRASARVRLRQWQEALDDAAAAEKQGRLTPQLLYYLSCVYAQAAGQVGLEARSGGEALAVRSQAVYEDSALKYLQRALGEMPADRRGKFWRDQVQTDPGLAAIRRTPLYLQLERQYGRERE